jgi:hypothetical protein
MLTILVSFGSFAVAQTCIQLPAGLVGWWPLDETSATTATDIMSGNDGTYVGDPTPVTGKVAGALSFDGIDDEIFVPSTQYVDPLGHYQNGEWLQSVCQWRALGEWD